LAAEEEISDITNATPIVKSVDEGIAGGLPMTGVSVPFTHATSGVEMKLIHQGAVELTEVVLLVVDAVLVELLCSMCD
jgi:hypothetical protein